MKPSRLVLVLALLLTVGGAGAAPSLATPSLSDRTVTPPSHRSYPAVVLVDGDVHRPSLLTRRTLSGLPQQDVTVSYSASGQQETHTFAGPLLLDVLQHSEPRVSTSRKNDVLNVAVRAVATDRYSAAVAWGEIDPGFEGKQVLVALSQDGQALERPRLVVPGDARGGRYVSDLIRLRVTNLAR